MGCQPCPLSNSPAVSKVAQSPELMQEEPDKLKPGLAYPVSSPNNAVEAGLAPSVPLRLTYYSGLQISVWQSRNDKRSPWLCLALTPPSPGGGFAQKFKDGSKVDRLRALKRQ
jgi:hypothetical protein